MKKIIAILGASLLLISASAYAVEDLTILGALKANQSVTRKVFLQEGKNTLEVFTGDNSKISCAFILEGYSTISVENNKTTRCVGNIALTRPLTLDVRVSNEENKDTDYRIWIHETK